MIDADSFLKQHPVTIDVPDADEPQPAVTRAARNTYRGAAAGSGEKGTDVDACMTSALRSLDAAAASEEGLRKRLRSKDYDDEAITAVIGILRRMGALDDEVFAEQLLKRCVSKMMGPFAVRREMASKGIDGSLASRLVDAAAERGEFDEAAERLVSTVMTKTRGLDYEKRLRRLASTAQRKGHSMSHIRRLAEPYLAASD